MSSKSACFKKKALPYYATATPFWQFLPFLGDFRNWLLTSGEVEIFKILMKGFELPFGN